MSTAESAYSLLITAGLLLNGLAVAGGTPVRALLAPLRDRGLLLGAVAIDLVVVPAALLLPTLVLDLRPGETAGLVLLAAASTGPIGIALTRIGRGDVPATVAIVTALGTANLVTVPALLAVLLPEAAGVPALEVGRTLLLLLVAPLGAGAVLRHLLGRRRWHPEAVARLARRLGAASTACIGAAVTVGLAIDPRGIVGELLGPPLVPALLMIAVAWVAAVLLTTDGPRRRSLWLASTARSVGVALAVAAIHLPGSAETRAAVLAVGGLTQALPILLLLGRDRWARPAGAPRRGVTPGRDAAGGPDAVADSRRPGDGMAARLDPGALLLDLDGVVTDTARAHEAAWRATLAAHGLPFDPAAYARTRGRSRADSLRELLVGRDVPAATFAAVLSEKDAAYRAALADLGPGDVLPGTAELVAAARARGWPVAIASSSRNARLVLDRLGLADRFDAVADGTSGAPKPAPDIFLAAAAAVGVPTAACVAVDDGGAGVDAALAAGMQVVGVGPADEVGHAHLRVATTAELDLDRIVAGLAEAA